MRLTTCGMLEVCILVDDRAVEHDLCIEHGFSAWVCCDEDCMLVDTGQGGCLRRNAHVLGVALERASCVMLSHGHYDHGNGLEEFFGCNAGAPVYLHSGALRERFSSTGGTVHAIGLRERLRGQLSDSPGRLRFADEPVRLSGALATTGAIPRRHEWEGPPPSQFLDRDCTTPDPVGDDIALYAATPEGTVVVTGCAHAGIANIMDHVSDLTGEQRIHTVIGGLHLAAASAERLERTIDAFGRHDVQRVAACHCTGVGAIEAIREELGERCIPCAGGTRIAAGGAHDDTHTRTHERKQECSSQ